MDVDDPGKLKPFLVSVNEFSLKVRKSTNADVHLRGGQECCDHLQNLRVAPQGVVESRGINEDNISSIEGKPVRELHLGGARLQAHPDI